MQNWITNLFRSDPPSEGAPHPILEAPAGEAAHLDSLVRSEICAWVAEEDVNRSLENGYTFYLDSNSSTGRCRRHVSEPGARAFASFLMVTPGSTER